MVSRNNLYEKGNPTGFNLLMSRFTEMKDTIEFDKVEKELKHMKEHYVNTTQQEQDMTTLIAESFKN